jgi:signal transduction protein with GAF and PtsI domain
MGNTMNDQYLNELKNDFEDYENQLKKLKKKVLKAKSLEEQAKIIKKIDSIARVMEANQQQAKRVTKSRLKERKSKAKK